MTKQPDWKLVANLGDVNPFEYGGYFVFKDETGVYDHEAVYLATNDDNTRLQAYRFSLERLKAVEDPETHVVYLVTENYDPADAAHPLHVYDEWFHKNLDKVAESMGIEDLPTLRAQFCSEDPLDRAHAYRAVGEYHGWENLDNYPDDLTKAEARKRYDRFLKP